MDEIMRIKKHMLFVISKFTWENGGRDIQSNSAWSANPYGEEYAVVPDDMVEKIMETSGFCNIELNEDGTEVVAFTALPIPAPQVNLEALAAEARAKRGRLLAETDWTQTLDAPISAECREAFRVYRQALRDITEQEGFPETIEWPAMPEVVKAAPDPVDTAVDVLLGGEEA